MDPTEYVETTKSLSTQTWTSFTDLFATLAGGQKFSKLDLSQTYHGDGIY